MGLGQWIAGLAAGNRIVSQYSHAFFRFLESVRFSDRRSADCSVGKTVQNNGKRVPQRWQLPWERETLSVLQQPFPLAEQGQFFGCGCLRFWA